MALGQIGQGEGADADSLQIENRMAQGFGCASDLTVATFPQGQFQLGGMAKVPKFPDVDRQAGAVIEGRTSAPAAQRGGARSAPHPHLVGLSVTEAWMGQPQGEITIVGDQQGATAEGIEAADRMETPSPPQIGRKQIKDRGAGMGVVAGTENSRGFVEQEGEESQGAPPGGPRPG